MTLADLLRRPRYELIPIEGAEREAVENVPRHVKLTVTASPSHGIEGTLGLTERLVGHGFEIVPHLPARLVVDEADLERIVRRLDGLAVSELFVVAGDAKRPAGEFAGAAELLAALARLGHPFEQIGITGYPESHPIISDEATIQAMFDKQSQATYIVSQIAFDADLIGAWVQRVRARGTVLPIYVGLPGAVDRRKLLRISTKIGLGDSARFLGTHSSWLRSLLLPRRYSPDDLILGLAERVADPAARIAGFHVFTFNDLGRTERWRRELLERLDRPGDG